MARAPCARHTEHFTDLERAMQRILDALHGGYLWVATGRVAADEWPAKDEALRGRYDTLNLTHRDVRRHFPDQRDNAHRLVAVTPKHATQTTYYLLARAPDATTSWGNAIDSRYRPRLGSYVASPTMKQSWQPWVWTWRLDADAYHGARDEILTYVWRTPEDQRLPALTALAKRAQAWVDFPGVRRQHRILGELLTSTWQNAERIAPCPLWPPLNATRTNTTLKEH